jgi:integrase
LSLFMSERPQQAPYKAVARRVCPVISIIGAKNLLVVVLYLFTRGSGRLDPYTKRWLAEYRQQRERKRRLAALKRFRVWLHKEPRSLLVQARRSRRRSKKIVLVLREYYRYLVNQKRAKSTAGQWYAVVRSYFTVNGLDLGKFPRKIGVQSVYEKSWAPSQDIVKQMVESRHSIRDKFVIAFLAQTGQRIGVLTAMKRDMITRVASGHGIVKVPPTLRNPRAENVNELGLPYTFVIGRDSMRLLRELPFYERGWLLDVSQRQMGRIVDEAARAIRIQQKRPTDIGRSCSTVHPNTFRKYWRNRMIEARSDLSLVMHMMGYKVPSILGSWKPTDEELLKAYENAESKLEVLGAARGGSSFRSS